MILFPDMSHKNSLQHVTMHGDEYVRIDHEFKHDDSDLIVFGGTCQNDTESTSHCPTIELVGDSDEIARLVANARVRLFEDARPKEGAAFNNDADFCLHYRDYVSGLRQGWRFHILRVHPSNLELYYADPTGDFEIIEITAFDKLTVSVPSDLQTFQVVKHCPGDIRIFTQVGEKWSPAVSIQQDPTSAGSSLIMSRYYPMSSLRDKTALEKVLNHVTEDGELYW